MTRAEIKAYRNKIGDVLTKVTTDAEAFKYAELYPLWSEYIDYFVGSIVRRPSGLYKYYNAIIANPAWMGGGY